ncbi:MAG: hypothetical protein M1824_001471 [Vezdaea acicularis]|nr:MAG: hypothetical protein M1824_001471 [Vezdaea acicularis]
MSLSTTSSNSYWVTPVQSTWLALIDSAVNEVSEEAVPLDDGRKYKQLTWSSSCEKLKVEYAQYYRKINEDYPEHKIINRQEVKRTGGGVYAFYGGSDVFNLFNLPGGELSLYIAIPMMIDGQLEMVVIDSKNQEFKIDWNKVAIVYLSGTSKLKCSGKGKMICILLRASRD